MNEKTNKKKKKRKTIPCSIRFISFIFYGDKKQDVVQDLEYEKIWRLKVIPSTLHGRINNKNVYIVGS